MLSIAYVNEIRFVDGTLLFFGCIVCAFDRAAFLPAIA